MRKIPGIILTLVVVSCFLYPFNPYFFPPALNTKMFLAVIGIAVCFFDMLRHRDTNVPLNLAPVFLMAALVSVVSMFSMTFNHTMDTAYNGYVVSMAVWFSAAYVVCRTIRFVHKRLDLVIVFDYLIVVCVIQCFIALAIDNYPAVQDFVDTRLVRGTDLMHELKRLYGIGCGLDTAGIRFSLCLVMIVYILKSKKDSLSDWAIIYYLASFVILTVVGSMVARTTYVGVVLAFGYFVLTVDYTDVHLSFGALKIVWISLLMVVLGTIVCVFMYRTDPSFRHWLRFAFEGFFNLFENGEWSIASNDTLSSMYRWPDNIKTWIIGDGYFSNPGGDINYLGIGDKLGGYYMGTDVGYCRFIFYFGLIGLVIFSFFLIKCCEISMKVLPEHKWFCLFTLACGFIVWLKVSTDVFFMFALLICVGNMRDPEELEAARAGELPEQEESDEC